ncbi:MAG: PIN domain nuclease [Aeromicrobium sp.]|uniref:PIN domain nuclease n=1 Tax=Aeromicrobium sp. TaxID=1871063 RepID=UPI0039E657C3
MNQRWLIDKSAYVRLLRSPDADAWIERMNRGLVSVTSLTLLELGYSAQSADHWRRTITAPPISSLPVEALRPSTEDRAVEVQGLLAERGHHRAAKIPDLLIAATAELAGFTVLHLDKDFELIASVTSQSVERLTGDF